MIRTGFIAIVIVLTAVMAAWAVPGDQWLVEMDRDASWQNLGDVRDPAVLWNNGPSVLLKASTDAVLRMENLGVAHTTLTQFPSGRDLYALNIRTGIKEPVARDPVIILKSGLKIYGFEKGIQPPMGQDFMFIRISSPGKPLSVLEPRPYESRGTRDHDPAIQTLVDTVSSTDLYDHLDTLCNFQTRYSTTQGCLNAVDWCVTQFEALGLTVETPSHTSGHAPNVIATQLGQINPDRIWIVGGHLDSTSGSPTTDAPGADDNGTGSVLTLHTAEILHNQLFEDTIIYALWTGEEFGLYGSEAWADWAYSQGMNIQGYLNFDMVGWVEPAPEDLNVIVNSASDAFGLDFVAALQLYTTLPIDYEIDASLTASDHASFWSNGYNSFCAIEDYWPVYPYYHTTNDTIDKVDFPFLTDCTKATVGATATFAGLMPREIIMASHTMDDSAGDNDGEVDPGETIDVVVTLKNYTDGPVTGVTAQLVPDQGAQYVTMISDTASFGDMAQYDPADNSGAPYQFTVAPGTPENTVLSFTLNISGTGYNGTATMAFTVTTRYYVCPVYEWNLDTDPGWTTEDQWAFGQPSGNGGEYGEPDPSSGYTGTNVFGFNLNGDYPDYMSEPVYLITSAIDCTDLVGVELQFQCWLGVEWNAYDHASIDVSNNNGVDWTNIWANGGVSLDGGAWELWNFDITNEAAGYAEVKIRWGMGSTDSAWAYCGWNIDDIEICGYMLGGEEPCLNHGDVNLSGDLTAGDAQMTFWIALGSYTPTPEEACAADCNGSGSVTAGDAQAVFEAALGTGSCVDSL